MVMHTLTVMLSPLPRKAQPRLMHTHSKILIDTLAWHVHMSKPHSAWLPVLPMTIAKSNCKPAAKAWLWVRTAGCAIAIKDLRFLRIVL